MSRCSGSPATSRWTEWLRSVPERLKRQVATLPWASSLSELTDGLTQRPLLFLPLALLIGALLWRRKALYARLNKVHQDIGHFKRDSQWHTPQAILINILLAMPVALGLALCGLRPADRRPRAERQPGRAANGPGLAGVLHRLPDSRAGRRGRTAFPLGKPQVEFLRGWIRRLGWWCWRWWPWWRWPNTNRRRWPTTCWASPWC
jgi:potassium efflux system protein